MADGAVSIQIQITKKYEHDYGAVYTTESFGAIRKKVQTGKLGATLGYTSKNPETLQHILWCLGVHYTDSEFNTLVAKLRDSIRYDEQLVQEIVMSRQNIYYSKRITKSDRLLSAGVQQHITPARRIKGRSRKSVRLIGPERRMRS